jgi:hypothetical protein
VALRDHATFGTIFDEKELTVTVKPGDRFSLAVPDGGSIGDEWSAAVAPDGVLTATGNRLVMSNLLDRIFGPQAGGGAGTRYFTYSANQRGTATVRLFDCFQGMCNTPYDKYSRAVTWTVTVK